MRSLLPLALIVPAALAGCASQQTLDAQTATTARDLDAMQQSLTRLAAAQQGMDARLAGLESRHTLLANRLDAQGKQPAALDGLRAETAALRAQLDAANAAIGRAQESADDAVKIARDSRRVSGKLADSLLLTESMVSYAYELPELTADGRAALDGLIAGVRPKLPNVFVEIVGYSDNLGLDSQNRRVALERAEAVRRYLHETGGIPLDRLSTISYGDLKPLASNVTAEGRGQNRRVWVRVLR